MSLLSPFVRHPWRRHGTVVVGPPADAMPPLPPVPPLPPLPPLQTVHRHAHGASERTIETARILGRALLSSAPFDDVQRNMLVAAVDEHVDVWTPALRLRSRDELIEVLADADDTFGDVTVVFTEVARTPSLMLEWRATGRFTEPAFVEDDQLIEPTGAVIEVGGTIVFSWRADDPITRICCYYDRLALIEQMLDPTTTRR